MIDMAEYSADKELHEGAHSIVYRGHRRSDGVQVILKILKKDYPLPVELARFKREYEMTRSIEEEGVIKAWSLEKYGNTLVIVLEDFGGDALSQLLISERPDLRELLTLAIGITDALGQIHQHEIMHKDINPSNIVWNPDSGQVKIIDFGISTKLPRERPFISNLNMLEGTLAYMSPEQTGRMNRSMDYRTDLYSLGCTLYEIFTGRPPFTTKEPMELVHSHIAKFPVPPHKLNLDPDIAYKIPRQISHMIMKLLSKMGEERYQSAFGIKHDLQKALDLLFKSGKVEQFEIGQQDISDRLSIPQKLYGREAEVEILMSALDGVNPEGCKIVLVKGPAGAGKSALVHEVQTITVQNSMKQRSILEIPIKNRSRYFISCKFDQLKRGTPYGPLIQAFKELIHHLLAESDEQISIWREKLLRALEPNGQVIVDVIPDLELIIGRQQEIPELGGEENLNRFNYVFEKFITTCASADNPLVIFMDDLQWADSASLNLIEMIIKVKSEYLYLIGAYRDDEVDEVHPLMARIEQIRKSGAVIEEIKLELLKESHVNQLISETFACASERSRPFAALCFAKTGGNPFFISQFIHYLYQEKLVQFAPSLGLWQWDEERISQTTITDNVVELMVSKIQKLSAESRKIISLAACIGGKFDLKTLSSFYGKSMSETAKELYEVLQEELITPLDGSYKYISSSPPDFKADHGYGEVGPMYRFLHDRVQQAAYLLIEERNRAQVHLKIAREMVTTTPEEGVEENIFNIVDQFNLSTELITDAEERVIVAQLNLVAGKKAKLSAAFDIAFHYLKSAIGMVEEKSWHTHYHLMLSLHDTAAETAYLCGEFKAMESLTKRVLQQAESVLDMIKAYEIRIQACQAQHKLQEAVNTGLYILHLLGVQFPDRLNILHFLSAYMQVKLALAQKGPDDLIKLQEMADPHKLALMRIMTTMSTSAYFASPDLLPLIVFKCVKLSARYGNTEESIFFYNAYGMVMCGVTSEIGSGFEFGKLALQLSNRLNARPFESRTQLHFHCFINHWKSALRETLEPLKAGFQKGLESGDFESAGGCAYCYFFHSYLAGKKLSEIEENISKYNWAIKKFRQKTWGYYNERNWQTILNLMGLSKDPVTITGDVFDENRVLAIYQKENNRSGICSLHINKLILCYLFHQYGQSVQNGEMAKKNLVALRSMIAVPVFYFYDSLSRLALFSGTTRSGKLSILIKIARNQRKMKRWAHHAPMNHLHKWHLVEAERARVLGKEKKAMDMYDLAIAGANKSQYLQEEALGYELAAKFYLSKGRKVVAHTYMREARYRYLKWGAMAKVRHMEEIYPDIFNIKSESEPVNPIGTLQPPHEAEAGKRVKPAKTGATSDRSESGTIIELANTTRTIHTSTTCSKEQKVSQLLDLNTIIKASQTISGEIRFDRLLEKMMAILIENAGAQKGIFLLERDGRWFMEWQGGVDGCRLGSIESASLYSTEPFSGESLGGAMPILPITVVRYIIHTRQPLILNNVFNEKQFSGDPYISRNRPCSILALPILHQNRVVAVVYLENNLTDGVFTPERLEILYLLSSQIAISIQNARLYANLEELVDARTHELSQTLENLKTTQNQLVESEKMAALGQLLAGIAHEINTPLGVIQASAGNMLNAFSGALSQLPELFERLSVEKLDSFFKLVQKTLEKSQPLTAREERKLRKEFTAKLEDENIEQASEISDTLVDMGIHENIEPFLPLLKEDDSPFFVQLAYNLSGQQRNSHTILTAVERASKTLFALKNYAHYDRSGEKVNSNILEGIETILTLYNNQLKQGVEVILTGFDEIPAIPCYPDELNQVWTNLIHNSLQAMEHRGKLEIAATQDGEHIIISITDSGCGIPEEIMGRIFEPFFTTRSRGEGSGLGLDICKRIVEKHNGHIRVTSEPGRTTFRVYLLK